MTDQEAFVAAARSLVGKARWRHRGRTAAAVDCVGLLVWSFARAGRPIEDVRLYGREPWEDQLRQECVKRWGQPLPPDQAQPGDLPIINWGRGEPSHIGVVGDHPDGGLTLIHAHNQMGVVEQSLRDRILAGVIEIYRPAWGAAHGP